MESNKKVVELNLEDILPNRFQPRIKFEETGINDLSASIKEHGVIQPIVVRKIGDKYEIIAGERRYKASVMAGLETIPAIITELNDKDSAEVALIENVQRQNLTPIEEAVSYKKILDMGYLTQEQLANKLGKSQSAIANKLRLLNLDDEVQEALLNGEISERHARSLLKLPNSKDQVKMLNRIIEERLTVRRTDEEIDKMLNDLFEANDFDKPEEVEDEIEHTQPLTFNFGSVEEPKENVFDIGMDKEEQEVNPFELPEDNNSTEPSSQDEPEELNKEKEETDFFGFNQNFSPFDNPTEENQTLNSNEPIKDEYEIKQNDFVDVNQIENEATDLYPKEEKKDINSFLEPTLLINDDFEFNDDVKEEPKPVVEEPKEEVKEPESNFNQDFLNDVKPVGEDLDLSDDRKPGKFFSLFNDNETEDNSNLNETPSFNSIFGDIEPSQPKEETSNFNSVFDNVEREPVKPQETNTFNSVFDNEEFNRFDEQPQNIFDNNEEIPEVVPQKLEAEDIEETVSKEDNSNINVALEKIKEYQAELKKLGIDMNIEESDFENKYQITINIDK